MSIRRTSQLSIIRSARRRRSTADRRLAEEEQHEREHRRRVEGVEPLEERGLDASRLGCVVEAPHDSASRQSSRIELAIGGGGAASRTCLGRSRRARSPGRRAGASSSASASGTARRLAGYSRPWRRAFAPVVVVELRLARRSRRGCRCRAPAGGLEEDGVLDEVEREERRAASVERLEDDLSVVVRFERDRDDLEQVAERDPQQSRGARPRSSPSSPRRPTPRSRSRKNAYASSIRLFGSSSRSVGGPSVGHDRLERAAVGVRRPDLKSSIAGGLLRVVPNEVADDRARRSLAPSSSATFAAAARKI